MAVVSDELLAAVEGLAATVQRESARRQTVAFIESTPGVCGGVACVRQTRIPVWTLIAFLRLGRSESDLLADYPLLTATDLDAVWTYYRDHTTEVDAAIAYQEQED